MAEDPRHQRELSPDEVASKVATILMAAERDALATIEAARRLPWLPHAMNVDDVGRGSRDPGTVPASGSDAGLGESLGELTRAVGALARRLDAIETALSTRTAPIADATERAPAASPPFPAWERAMSAERVEAASGARAERMRAVDLALRGFSRAQIAAELRASLSEPDVQRLLDEVLEQG
jgi:hypothetical protein